jgi:hypothetical protein
MAPDGDCITGGVPVIGAGASFAHANNESAESVAIRILPGSPMTNLPTETSTETT